MPKFYDFMICGYYLYFTSHCIIEAMHVHASDKHLTESCSAKLFVMSNDYSNVNLSKNNAKHLDYTSCIEMGHSNYKTLSNWQTFVMDVTK